MAAVLLMLLIWAQTERDNFVMCCVIWTRKQKTGSGPLVRIQPLSRSHLWRKENPFNTIIKLDFSYGCDGTQRKRFLPQSSAGTACRTGPILLAHPISPLPWCCNWWLPTSAQIVSCFSYPTWDLRRSSPHCWGQSLKERLLSLLYFKPVLR